jgi:hypothetical protein
MDALAVLFRTKGSLFFPCQGDIFKKIIIAACFISLDPSRIQDQGRLWHSEGK